MVSTNIKSDFQLLFNARKALNNKTGVKQNWLTHIAPVSWCCFLMNDKCPKWRMKKTVACAVKSLNENQFIYLPVLSGRHGCHCLWGWQRWPAGFCQCLPRLPPDWRGRRRTGQWWPVLSGRLALCSEPWSLTITGKETLRKYPRCGEVRHLWK